MVEWAAERKLEGLMAYKQALGGAGEAAHKLVGGAAVHQLAAVAELPLYRER